MNSLPTKFQLQEPDGTVISIGSIKVDAETNTLILVVEPTLPTGTKFVTMNPDKRWVCFIAEPQRLRQSDGWTCYHPYVCKCNFERVPLKPVSDWKTSVRKVINGVVQWEEGDLDE